MQPDPTHANEASQAAIPTRSKRDDDDFVVEREFRVADFNDIGFSFAGRGCVRFTGNTRESRRSRNANDNHRRDRRHARPDRQRDSSNTASPVKGGVNVTLPPAADWVPVWATVPVLGLYHS